MKAYPRELLEREMAFIAYYLHWSFEEILRLEHRDRRSWCDRVSEINKSLNEESRKLAT